MGLRRGEVPSPMTLFPKNTICQQDSFKGAVKNINETGHPVGFVGQPMSVDLKKSFHQYSFQPVRMEWRNLTWKYNSEYCFIGLKFCFIAAV